MYSTYIVLSLANATQMKCNECGAILGGAILWGASISFRILVMCVLELAIVAVESHKEDLIEKMGR